MIPFRLVPNEGSASATSQLNAEYGAEKAFQTDAVFPWCSGNKKTFPESIKFHFDKEISIAKIGFSTRSHVDQSQAPNRFWVSKMCICDFFLAKRYFCAMFFKRDKR